MKEKCVIDAGFGGYAEIGGNFILLTSYNLSMQTNYVVSSANGRIFDGQKFKRQSLSGYRDFAEYSLSLSFDATVSSFNFLIGAMVDNPHGAVRVKFIEKNHGIEYDFADAYISKVGVEVGNNSACSISVDFAVFRQKVEVSMAKKDYLRTRLEQQDIVIMPYYSFDVVASDRRLARMNKFIDFSFNIEQSIERRYGCCGSISTDVADPMYLLFGKQRADFSFSLLDYCDEDDSDSSDSSQSEEDAIGELTMDNSIFVVYRGQRIIEFRKAFCHSYSPGGLSDPGAYHTLQVSGVVYGEIVRSAI